MLIAGLWPQLCACKEVITEPSNVSGEVFDEAIKSYRLVAVQTFAVLACHTLLTVADPQATPPHHAQFIEAT